MATITILDNSASVKAIKPTSSTAGVAAPGLISGNNMDNTVKLAYETYTATVALSVPATSVLGMLYFSHPIIPIHGYVNGTGFATGATVDIGYTQTFDFSVATLVDTKIQWFGATIPIASTNSGESPFIGGLTSSTGVPANQFTAFSPINTQAGLGYAASNQQVPFLVVVRVNTAAMSTGAVLKLGLLYSNYYL